MLSYRRRRGLRARRDLHLLGQHVREAGAIQDVHAAGAAGHDVERLPAESGAALALAAGDDPGRRARGPGRRLPPAASPRSRTGCVRLSSRPPCVRGDASAVGGAGGEALAAAIRCFSSSVSASAVRAWSLPSSPMATNHEVRRRRRTTLPVSMSSASTRTPTSMLFVPRRSPTPRAVTRFPTHTGATNDKARRPRAGDDASPGVSCRGRSGTFVDQLHDLRRRGRCPTGSRRRAASSWEDGLGRGDQASVRASSARRVLAPDRPPA